MNNVVQYVRDVFFPKLTNGHFVDIGAFDGVTNSNTLLFEKTGWSGVCVEPNPEIINKLRYNRTCTVKEVAVSSDQTNKSVSFHAFRGFASTKSGLVESMPAQVLGETLKNMTTMGGGHKEISVKTISYDELIGQTHVDYLTIDIPDIERVISKSNFKQNVHVASLATENTQIRTLMDVQGYSFVTRIDRYDIFVRPKLRKFVINLARRSDRLKLFQERCRLAQVFDVEHFSAVDGKQLQESDPRVQLFPSTVRRGAIGCALSHLHLWRQLLADHLSEYYLVLEDDTEFNDDFSTRFSELLTKQLPTKPLWNIVWLGFTGPELHAKKRIPGPSRLENTGWEYYGGTWAYLISKRGAKTLVDLIMAKKCTTTIDSWLSHMGPVVFPTLKCTPYLCWTEMGDTPGADSDIQQDTKLVTQNDIVVEKKKVTPNDIVVEKKKVTPNDMVEKKKVVRIGMIDGGEWFAPFMRELFSSWLHPEIFPLKPHSVCDLMVLSIMGVNHKSLDHNGIRICIVGEARPVQDVLQKEATLHMHTCLPETDLTDLKSESVLRCVDGKSLWYVPQWVTSFYERKNPEHTLERFLKLALKSTPINGGKDKFCAFMYSNEVDHRNRFFDLLNAYKPVDGLGKCRQSSVGFNDRSLYDSKWTFYDAAVERYEGYKFVIAFENTIQRGYITEKLINPRLCKNPPLIIYYGAPDVETYFNAKSFINVADFPNFDLAIEYIKQVDQNDQLYQEIQQQPFMTTAQTRQINLAPVVNKLKTLVSMETTTTTTTTASANPAISKQTVVPPVLTTDDKSSEEWTMVSALFDIPTDTGVKASNRSIDFYLTHRFVIEMDVPLVMFCDPATYPKVWAIRKKAGLLHRTCFVTMHIRDFPLYAYHDRIAENRKKPPVYALDHRNTPAFFVLTASKFYMMKRAIEMNPFGSKFVSWCDYGIQHVGDASQAKKEYVLEAWKQKREKPSFCYIAYVSPQISLDPYQMYSFGDGRCTIAAGFFTGRNDKMLKLCGAIEDEFKRVVLLGRGHAEEQLLATVHARDPSAFDLFYGDYYELISNYAHVRTNAEAVLTLFIDRSANDCNWSWTLDACRFLHSSQYNHNSIVNNGLSPSQTVRLFERYISAATELKLDQLRLTLEHQFQQLLNSVPLGPLLLKEAHARKSNLIKSTAIVNAATTTTTTIVRRVIRGQKPIPDAPAATAASTASSLAKSNHDRVRALLDAPLVPVSDDESKRLSVAAWTNLDAVVYINLDTRKDRAADFLNEMKRLRVPPEKIHRFSGIRSETPVLGCSTSHLMVLKMAQEQKWRNVLVCEDDFAFIGNTRLVWENIASFFKMHADFDVIQLTSHNLANTLQPCDHIVQFARKASNAAGYVVNAHFYDKLINRWDSTIKQLKLTNQDWVWVNDQSWQALQTGNWFACIPLLGYQRPSFSDLSNKPADPHGITEL